MALWSIVSSQHQLQERGEIANKGCPIVKSMGGIVVQALPSLSLLSSLP